ncbi:MAG: N-acetylmuramoyl-L-alanine amidase [Streptosporangiales bacterium]|nr:N-acetylmuramoyl-L-alanine amidase [Streptosporangiales bacterium]
MHRWVRAVGLVVVAVAAVACSTPGSGARTVSPTPSSTPAGSASSATPSGTPSASAPLDGLVVVVDPGHNGRNAANPRRINKQVDAGGLRKPCNTTGTETNDGYPEHAFNWDVAKRLTALLEKQGATVVLTRRNDKGVGPCVDQRGLTAARHDADLLVSIHADGSAPGGHGFSVLRPGRVPGYTTATYKRSKVLASDIVTALADGGLIRSTYLGERGVTVRRDLGTLNRASVPAVMLEAGNMRNARDARLLASERGRQRIAVALASGVAAFGQR